MVQDLTVSIVSHGHGDLLGGLLDDLRQQVPGARIIVTMNIAEPEFNVAAWPQVEFRQNVSPKGFGANHNAALRAASSGWYAILNPDIRLTDDTFVALERAIEQNPEIDMLAPRIVGPDGADQDSARPLPTPLRVLRRVAVRMMGGEPSVCAANRSTWFAGMFLLVRKRAFWSAGGFDERFFMYGEDVALSIQMVAQGSRIRSARHSIAVHDARRATLRSFRHLRWHVASLLRLWTSPGFYRHERRYRELEDKCLTP